MGRRGRKLPMHVGAQREFAQEARRLIERPGPTGPANLVRISIPKDHPLAKELWELSCLLAERQKLVSGIEIQRRAIPGADEKLCALLSRMGVNVEQIKKDLAAGDALAKGHDPLLDAGLGLLRVASSIAGAKIDLPKIEDELRRMSSQS